MADPTNIGIVDNKVGDSSNSEGSFKNSSSIRTNIFRTLEEYAEKATTHGIRFSSQIFTPTSMNITI